MRRYPPGAGGPLRPFDAEGWKRFVAGDVARRRAAEADTAGGG